MSNNKNKPKKIRSYYSSYMLPWYILGVFIVFGFIFIGARLRIDSVPAVASSSTDQELLTIEVPNRAIKKGEPLEQVPFSSIKWPSSSRKSVLIKKSDYNGYFATENLQAYTPVAVSALSQTPLDLNIVAGGIPRGYRAITVKVDVESAVEGWAQTGNHVDVILMKQSSDPELGIEAKVIAENVKILSAGASAEKVKGSVKSTQAPPTVTLLVTQEDALKVRTASTIGKLTFALRGIGDESPTQAVQMNQRNLVGGSRSLQLNKQKEKVKGMAKGPDGSMYILDENSGWIQKENTEKITE